MFNIGIDVMDGSVSSTMSVITGIEIGDFDARIAPFVIGEVRALPDDSCCFINARVSGIRSTFTTGTVLVF